MPASLDSWEFPVFHNAISSWVTHEHTLDGSVTSKRMSELMQTHSRGAVIVCHHVAKLNYPILRAKRDDPIFPEDTGWQFLCDRHKHETQALVWAVEEIVAHDPSLDEYLDCAPGAEIFRSDKDTPWQSLT